MNTNVNLHKIIKTSLVVLVVSFLSCQPDEIDEGNGILQSNTMDASFTITAVEGKNNTYLFTANNNYATSQWNVDDGSGFSIGKNTKEVFFPDAGTYKIEHKVTGIGGAFEVDSKDLVIDKSDPLAGNIVAGGKFETSQDISNWSIVNISASGTEWTFADGKATVKGGNWNQKGLYQEVDVIEGVTYKIDMLASSTSGVSDTWFEVFASATKPVDGSDYSAGGKLITINTWAGCGSSPFSGKLSEVGCDLGALTNPNEPGKFVAQATETIYLVIKSGGGDLKDGISIDNIEMRATN